MRAKGSFRRKVVPLLLCTTLFGIAGGFESISQATGVREGYLIPRVRGDAALGMAAGQFRVVIANLLWSKVVDHYHHVFMAQGGDWSKNVALLPLLRTITELDPHFTQAYQLEGGTILPRTGHIAEGQAVLAEGLRNNPNDWEMYREIALLYAWREHEPALALPYARAGLVQVERSHVRGQMSDADYAFADQLMRRLCRTLWEKPAPTVTVSGHPRRAPSAQDSAEAAVSRRQVTG